MFVDCRLSDAADYPARCLPDIVSIFSIFASPPRPALTIFVNNVLRKICRGLGKPACPIWPFQRPKTARVSPLPTEMLFSEWSVHCTSDAKQDHDMCGPLKTMNRAMQTSEQTFDCFVERHSACTISQGFRALPKPSP